MKPTLIFVYNAKGGLFNALLDVAHKALSPQTYSCNLCALTHSNFGMRKEWKKFIAGLDASIEFLHADELSSRYGIKGEALPVILKSEEDKLTTLVDAKSINACRSIEELKELLELALNG